MTDREVMQQALEALEHCCFSDCLVTDKDVAADAILAIKQALEQPEQEQMRMPKAGDKVICLEDESIGTIVSLTAGGSPDITFDDGSRGTYMLREFAELFGYVTPPAAQPEQEPVVFYRCNGCGHAYEQVHPTSCDCMGAGGFDRVEYFTTPPAAQRKPLTDDQIDEIAVIARRGNLHDLRIAIEAKLKERNT